VGGVKTFEDFDVWKASRLLVKEIYTETNKPIWSKDFGLKDQVRRAVVSVLSNIAEGSERESKKEFARFIAIAKGSAVEVRAHLYIALDLGYFDQQTVDNLSAQAREIGRMLGGFHKYLIADGSANSRK